MKFLIILFALFAISSCSSIAAEKSCSRDEAIKAETEVSSLPDWDSLYRAFLQFGHCDDGAIGEGYSETVGRLFANDWEHFENLRSLTMRDKRFERFVIWHIDETVPSDYLDKIIDNVNQRCPSDSKKLCKLIYGAAK